MDHRLRPNSGRRRSHPEEGSMSHRHAARARHPPLPPQMRATASGRCLSSSCGPPILAFRAPDWGMVFYIRIDRGGSFHTYPHVGGPFKSFQEADIAIARYLHDRRDPQMFMGGISDVEMCVKHFLYWPDGTRKGPKFQANDKIRDWTHLLVQALVDKYNEDHNLLGDLAYELKDVLRSESICEGDVFSWYYHINFTTKTKGADGFDRSIDNLFFAEVISTKGKHDELMGKHEELVSSCFRMLKPVDNGRCHGCEKKGSDMKHPNDADAYTGGHQKYASLPFGGPELPIEYPVHYNDDFEAAEVDRIRTMYKDVHDPRGLDRYEPNPPGTRPATKAMLQKWVAMGEP